jgi:hypothetical protein
MIQEEGRSKEKEAHELDKGKTSRLCKLKVLKLNVFMSIKVSIIKNGIKTNYILKLSEPS